MRLSLGKFTKDTVKSFLGRMRGTEYSKIWRVLFIEFVCAWSHVEGKLELVSVKEI